jgi:hypothetical protein
VRQSCSEIFRFWSIGGTLKLLLAHDVMQMMSTIAAPDVKYVIELLPLVLNLGYRYSELLASPDGSPARSKNILETGDGMYDSPHCLGVSCRNRICANDRFGSKAVIGECPLAASSGHSPTNDLVGRTTTIPVPQTDAAHNTRRPARTRC